MPEKAETINGKQFEDIIIAGKAAAVVCFMSEWSEPCRMMSGVIDDLAAHYNGKLPFYVIDPDEDALTAAAASILSIPTTIFYKDGAELGRTVGIREFEYITNIIDNNMI